MVQSGTARCALQSPCPTHRTASRMWIALAVVIAHAEKHDSIPNGDTDRRGWRQSSGRIDFAPPMCALPHSTPDAGGPISRVAGGLPERPKTEPERRSHGKA